MQIFKKIHISINTDTNKFLNTIAYISMKIKKKRFVFRNMGSLHFKPLSATLNDDTSRYSVNIIFVLDTHGMFPKEIIWKLSIFPEIC